MSLRYKYVFKFLKFLAFLFIRSKIVPSTFKVNNSLPTVYILPSQSKFKLLILRATCIKNKLPDPLDPLLINNKIFPRYFFLYKKKIYYKCFKNKIKKINNIVQDFLKLQKIYPKINIQIVPVLINFGRNPNIKNFLNHTSKLKNTFNIIKNLINVIKNGRNTFVYYSSGILLSDIFCRYSKNKMMYEKLQKLANIFFIRQKIALIGPTPVKKSQILKKILSSKKVKKAIKNINECNKNKVNIKKIKKIVQEISANVSYTFICLIDILLNFFFTKVYKKIYIYNSNQLRKLAHNRYNIIYIPCHRSHMDYLLLSYVIYHEGLSIPYIAAGINLNFWPAGTIFRKLGAFFIRRTFNSNKLYFSIVKEYLNILLKKGHSIQYFIEGKRSRTGFFLNPKTGMLNMTIQAILSSNNNSIALVPIYIGYEDILETESYLNELKGNKKEKEGLKKTVHSFFQLRNLGNVYINFGKPLLLITYLNKHFPNWHNKLLNQQEPISLTSITQYIAKVLAIRINQACIINPVNFCATILLTANKNELNKTIIINQLNFYIYIFCTISPNNINQKIINKYYSGEKLLFYFLSRNKITIKKNINQQEETIFLSEKQKKSMLYYKNNIYHILAIPSLLALIIKKNFEVDETKLIYQICLMYPFLKNQLFLHWNINEIPQLLKELNNKFFKKKVFLNKNKKIKINILHYHTANILSKNISDILDFYFIVFYIFLNSSLRKRYEIEKKFFLIAQNVFFLYHNFTLVKKVFDKTTFSTLMTTLREEKYINNNYEIIDLLKMKNMFFILKKLINKNVQKSIKSYF
ncbi:glycerol-3-phosphate 1-O-acyltransferase PlsB [Candidatus Tachikawaea gelatinosa]|uniref:Glycerol-3-phosphate acyltransferase n=1 Tax=Candidatus Tachikawaea gelatinosa TaxID=1410383 RepID=A0A090AJH8_9ENTR|nr:glycerol-3-phosphate 1-O-acyltransferase PlsB [Candidatus Tachikawaea gelatinosa]BAP58598.1 glycerol-3-phosphate acyltransferase [Candidatus Tachikawaea gelatinosa]